MSGFVVVEFYGGAFKGVTKEGSKENFEVRRTRRGIFPKRTSLIFRTFSSTLACLHLAYNLYRIQLFLNFIEVLEGIIKISKEL